MFMDTNLIMGDDLNFTLNHGELWGSTAHLNLLADYFIQELEMTRMVDLELTKIKPTWANNAYVLVVVVNRLDCFLLHSHIVLHGGRIRT